MFTEMNGKMDNCERLRFSREDTGKKFFGDEFVIKAVVGQSDQGVWWWPLTKIEQAFDCVNRVPFSSPG